MFTCKSELTVRFDTDDCGGNDESEDDDEDSDDGSDVDSGADYDDNDADDQAHLPNSSMCPELQLDRFVHQPFRSHFVHYFVRNSKYTPFRTQRGRHPPCNFGSRPTCRFV